MNVKTLLLSVSFLAPLCLHAQQYSPIPATGYNQDAFVGVGETLPNGAFGSAPATTATWDGGNAGDTFYVQGFNTAAPTTGLPSNGMITTTGGMFALQSATANNVVYDGGALTFATPAAYSSIALLGSSGNSSNAAALTVTVNYLNGTTQTFGPNLTIGLDWFFQPNPAFTAHGRVNVANGNLDNVGDAANPSLYTSILTLTDTRDPISSVTINGNGVNSQAVVAISGVASVPEPSTAVLLGVLTLGGVCFLRRRAAGSVIYSRLQND